MLNKKNKNHGGIYTYTDKNGEPRSYVINSIIDGDPVNHPSHYAETVPGVECIDVTKHFSFCRGNAIKYLWRAGKKDAAKTIEDLKKARWYIDKEIEMLGGDK